MEKILISACLLGINVRYNAVPKSFSHQCIANWQKQRRLITVCPEVSGGLATPRAPAEISPKGDIVITTLGNDVTLEFKRGAEHALHLCQRHNIRFALLKESSPSCGSSNIYNGHFTGVKKSGQGITAQLLTRHGIEVFSEQTIDGLIQALTDIEKKYEMLN